MVKVIRMQQVWVVRAGRGGLYASMFLSQKLVAIDFEMSDFGRDSLEGVSKEEIRGYYESVHPDQTTRTIASQVGQIYRFASSITKGSKVATYDPDKREYHVGTVTGTTARLPEVTEGTFSYCRPVRWERTIERNSLTEQTLNSIGAISTVFQVSEVAAAELLGTVEQLPQSECDELGQLERLSMRPSQDDALEAIKDKILGLNEYAMEDLVAGVLRSVGYKTRMNRKAGQKHGPDGGIDVFASPDGLCLASPRIAVEVKHRRGSMGSPEIRSFITAAASFDSGLYVSTGGFTKDAKAEAARSSSVHIELLDLDDFARLLVSNYDAADEESCAILPLERIWWPV